MSNDDQNDDDTQLSFMFAEAVFTMSQGLNAGEALLALTYVIAKILTKATVDRDSANKAAEALAFSLKGALETIENSEHPWSRNLQ